MVFATVFFCIFFGLYSVVLLGLLWPRRPLPALTHYPRVSILVAARNEAACIERCLQALAALDYPAEQLEILIGDDASTDETWDLVQRFIADKPQFRLLPIRHRLGSAQGKSNVLAHLCRAASSDYLLFTDADMALAPGWVRAMLAAATPGVGVVTGITTSEGGLFGRWQGLDWLFGLSLARLFSDCGVPVTAVGNNMLVTRAAYASIGGFEALAFTVSEDLQLFNQIVGQGWKFRNLIDPQVLGISAPQPTVRQLLHQRKRWMTGANRLPWQFTLLFSFYGMFYTVLGWPGVLPLGPMLALLAGKVLCQTCFLAISLRQAGHRERLGVLVFYEGYLLVMSLTVLAYTVWPSGIQWKERRYRWAEA